MKKTIEKMMVFSIMLSSLAYGGMKEDVVFLNELYNQGKYEMAVQQSKKFLTTYPESKYNKNLCKRIALISYLSNNFQDSKLYFQKYLTEYKVKKDEKAEAYSYLYRIAILEKNMEKANEYRNLVSENKKIYEEMNYDSGIILLNDGRNKEAIEHFNRAMALKGNNSSKALLYKSLALLNLGDYQNSLNAINVYNNLDEKNKDMALVTYLYGVLNYKLNDINKAIAYLESGLKNFPNDSYTQKGKLVLIEIYLNRSESNKALKLYSELSDTDDITRASKIFGNYFVTKSEYRRAIDFFDKIPNKDVNAQYAYAYSYFKENNFQRALKEFEKIKAPEYMIDVRYYEILSYYNLKNYKKIKEFQKDLDNYLTDSKKYNDVRIVLANSMYELEDYKKSYEYYMEIYKDYPTLENLYRTMVIARKIEDENIIDKLLKEYKDKFSDDKQYKKEVYILVGDLYYKKDKYLKAENLYKEYLKTTQDIEISNKLVDLLVNEKKYSDVIKTLNTMEVTDENQYLKGIAYMGIGNYSKAAGFFGGLEKSQNLDKELLNKVKYSTIKNQFLWEKYDEVITLGKVYIENSNGYKVDDISDILGITYYRKEDFKTARDYFTQLLKYKERFSYAKYQIADTYYAEKDYAKALELFKEISNNKIYKLEYRESSNYWALRCYINLDDKKTFLDESQKFMNIYKNSTYNKNLMIMRGKILVEEGNLKTALQEYQRLYLKLSSKNDKVERDLTVEKIIDILFLDNNKVEAKTWIDKLEDKYKKAYYSSIYYRDMDMIEEARKVEPILLESSTYKDYGLKVLADDEFSNNQYKEALKHYEEIYNLEVSSYKDYALYMMGDIYAIEKNIEEATVTLTKVFLVYPQSKYVIPAQIKLAEVYEISGDIDKAMKAYEELSGNSKAQEYSEFILEKLLYLNLQKENIEAVLKYYEDLKSINKDSASKYQDIVEKIKEAMENEKSVETTEQVVENIVEDKVKENIQQDLFTEETVNPEEDEK